MDIKYLHKQHKEIKEALNSLSQKLSVTDNIPENAFSLSMAIASIAGKLRIHLSTEDKYLYPALCENRDQNIRKTAQEFIDEMGNLNEVFDSYKTKYMNASMIRTNPAQFLEETKKITDAILKRIEKEEKELYTLL